MKGYLFAGALVVLGALWAPASASADYVSGYGYPCRVSYSLPTPSGAIPIGPTSGQYGSVYVTFYSDAFCAGTYVRSAVLYSTGSNAASLTGSAALYDQPTLLGHWQSLQRAAEAGERVYFTGSTWTAGTFFSGTQLNFVRFADY